MTLRTKSRALLAGPQFTGSQLEINFEVNG